MNEKNKDIALFRISVLGQLTNRGELEHGELKKIVAELAAKPYCIPYSNNCHLSPKTIERWYYNWKRSSFDGLFPSTRKDRGFSHIEQALQDKILQLKKELPSRSLNTIIHLLESQGVIGKGKLSRASLHRFLKKNKLSQRTLSDTETIERRSFEASHAGEIWQGDVMHGPMIMTPNGKRKVYLVSLMDDFSRLIVHSAFCFGETALDIEGVLKQALLKRGLPGRLIIDNGAAYRSGSLQEICARLEIRLVYCPAYEPMGKGKIERFHRVFREQFLTELIPANINGLDDLNPRLWAWLEQVYHLRPHSAFADKSTPIARWRASLIHVRPLGRYAHHIDDYFYHRIQRTVKKDGSVSWEGERYEVPYELSGEKIQLVICPHTQTAVKVESLQGDYLGAVTKLDKQSNCHRKRQRPASTTSADTLVKTSVVESALASHNKQQLISTTSLKNTEED